MDVEAAITELRGRVAFLEGEVRVFTPPVSRLEREILGLRLDVSAFRLEEAERFEVVNRTLRELSAFRNEANVKFDRLETNVTVLSRDVTQIKSDVAEIKSNVARILEILGEK